MTTICSIPGCPRPTVARTWCDPHYRRWRRHGDPTGGLHHRTSCAVQDCPRPHSANGLCGMHNQRVRRTGDPLRTRDDVDEIAVERAVMGDPPPALTTAERELVVHRLHREGYTDARIAEHLDIGPSGVWTIRVRLGLPSTTPTRKKTRTTGAAS